MAELALGIGSSHGPLLMLSPADWDRRTEADRVFPAHPFQGRTYSFDELLALRRNDYLVEMNTLPVRTRHYDRCQVQLDALAQRLKDAALDALVIIGDDHKEWYLDAALPALSVFCGDEVVNRGYLSGAANHSSDSISEVQKRRHPAHDTAYRCASGLARHIVESAIEAEFDVAASETVPADETGAPKCLGHAYSFVAHRLMDGAPPPMVPVIVNTYYPPNQPSAKRCWGFGRMLARAIRAWDEDARVAVIASGGLSHFVIDEDFDREMLAAMQARDAKTLTGASEALFQSGTSETKNWIVTAGAMAETDFAMDVLDYVPCYRSEAGTGNAMAFAAWS